MSEDRFSQTLRKSPKEDLEIEEISLEDLSMAPAKPLVQQIEQETEHAFAALGMIEPVSAPVATSLIKENGFESLQQQVVQLQTERDQLVALHQQTLQQQVELQKECEQLRALTETKSATSAFARERELLGLREIINKKEKEILDLRDALDQRDRMILDAREKSRDLEKSRRDVDERVLQAERESMAARESTEALLQDKTLMLEREKGLKTRLEETQRKLLKTEEQIKLLQQQLVQDKEQAEERLNHEQMRLQLQLAEQEQVHKMHAQAMQDLNMQVQAWQAKVHQQEAIQAHLTQQHETNVETLRNEHKEAMAQLLATHQQASLEAERAHVALQMQAEIRLKNERERWEAKRLEEVAVLQQQIQENTHLQNDLVLQLAQSKQTLATQASTLEQALQETRLLQRQWQTQREQLQKLRSVFAQGLSVFEQE